MQVQAVSKSVRVSPRKVRLMADAVRHLSLEKAMLVLHGSQKRAAGPLFKTLQSAAANAVNNAKLDKNDLVIKTIMINEGLTMKRFRPSTRGRIHPYKKRGSHITVILESVAAVAKPVAAKKVAEKVADKKETKKVVEEKGKKE